MKTVSIRPQPRAVFLHSWMYMVFYAFFVIAVLFSQRTIVSSAPSWDVVVLFFGIGIIPVLVRCYLANRFSSCEIRNDKVVVTHGMFKWRREFTYEELSEVTANPSILFGGKLWYCYFFTKKMMKRRYPVYSIALIGISQDDAYTLVQAMALKGVTVQKDTTLRA